jgi:hypothetical protein
VPLRTEDQMSAWIGLTSTELRSKPVPRDIKRTRGRAAVDKTWRRQQVDL